MENVSNLCLQNYFSQWDSNFVPMTFFLKLPGRASASDPSHVPLQCIFIARQACRKMCCVLTALGLSRAVDGFGTLPLSVAIT